MGFKAPRREHSQRAYLTHQQVDELAVAMIRDGLVVRFLAYTGLRYGEMAALAVADFDMLRRRVQVRRSVTEVKGKLVSSTPKSHERRSVPFPRFLTEDLARRMAGKGRDELVFAAPGGGVLRIATFRTRVFNPAVAKLRGTDDDGKPTTDWARPTTHDLRHAARISTRITGDALPRQPAGITRLGSSLIGAGAGGMRSLGSRQPLLNVLEQSHQIRDVLVVDVSLRDLKGLNLVLRTLQRRQRPQLNPITAQDGHPPLQPQWPRQRHQRDDECQVEHEQLRQHMISDPVGDAGIPGAETVRRLHDRQNLVGM
jgi:hypothetical protein